MTALIDARGALGPEQVRERLARELDLEREHGVQYWPIFLRDGGALAGCCGLHPREPGVFELGFHLCAEAWGRGVATEAARAVIAHAFGPLGARALFAGHHPRNDGSRAVLEKLGFRFTHRERYPPTGLDHPSYLLSRA